MSHQQEPCGEEATYEDNDLVLNYHDAVIYGSDLRLLQSHTEWLNDACIHFFFTLLQKTTLSREQHCTYMDPSVALFFMHQCIEDEEIDDFVSSFMFQSGGTIFVPINDYMAKSSKGRIDLGCGVGTHWSLLVICTREKEVTLYWHFDSAGRSNKAAASDFADKISKHVFRAKSPATVVDASTPMQTNGYDCGMHVLVATKVFSRMLSANVEDYEIALKDYIRDNPNFCERLRDEISNEIIYLASHERN